jgi:AbrB family looped-hinge helix DNA binding protein
MPTTQCTNMMKKTIFYGSATVGERGQIVLPVKLRKEFNIKKGEKLLVIGNPHHTNILLVNPETMNRYLEIMSENINEIKSTIKKK